MGCKFIAGHHARTHWHIHSHLGTICLSRCTYWNIFGRWVEKLQTLRKPIGTLGVRAKLCTGSNCYAIVLVFKMMSCVWAFVSVFNSVLAFVHKPTEKHKIILIIFFCEMSEILLVNDSKWCYRYLCPNFLHEIVSFSFHHLLQHFEHITTSFRITPNPACPIRQSNLTKKPKITLWLSEMSVYWQHPKPHTPRSFLTTVIEILILLIKHSQTTPYWDCFRKTGR